MPGYDPDVAKNRLEARGIMEKLGYAPDNRLAIKVSARNIAPTGDPAVLLTGQLKEVYIDAELEMVDTTNWFPKVLRRTSPSAWWSVRTGSTTRIRISTRIMPAAPRATMADTATLVGALIDRQSMETDTEKRRCLV